MKKPAAGPTRPVAGNNNRPANPTSVPKAPAPKAHPKHNAQVERVRGEFY